MAKKLRFAILSFAHIHAYSYARVLKELEKEGEVEFVAIFDDNRERLYTVGRKYGVKKLYYNLDEMLKKEELDAVIVTSENARHKEMVIPVAEKGLHILCEKPIATSLKDADEMIRVAEKNGVKFQQAFVMRYHGVTVKVKELIEEGAIGEIHVITATNHGKYPGLWFGIPELSGGGAVMDHTVHVADLMRWYTKSEAEEVHAYIGTNIRANLPCEDVALISLRFKNGVIGSIDCSWSRPSGWPIWGDVYMAIFGSEGLIIVDAFRTCIDLVTDGKPLVYRYFGTDCDYEMIKDFVRVIREDDKPRATAYDGRQALEIALAAYESARKGQPVKLPLKY